MKRIRALDGPTCGLSDYLECDGTQANWEGFRSHRRQADKTAYSELIEALQSFQHGLCGYCEIKLTELNRQIEHVIPQSDPNQGPARVLDPTNMLACCKGGTRKTDDAAQWLAPVKRNLSCGQAKEDSVYLDFVDPRMLPALPSLVRVRFDGEITVDEIACADAAIDTNKVKRTIEILGLNVERLRVAREKRWRALSDNWREYYDDQEVMMEAARTELSLGHDGNLPTFFTTSRSYFFPLGEDILAEAPQAWI